MAFFETEEDGALAEWETHFVIARTLLKKLQWQITSRIRTTPDCESG